MNNLKEYITEKFRLSKNIKLYKYFPKTRSELKALIGNLIEENGIDVNLNDIDTSEITDMSYLFQTSDFCGDISEWNVSNVTDMSGMFSGSKFNGDISSWDVSNVINMKNMFSDDKSFNGDLSKWDISKVENMYGMFQRCGRFIGYGLENWNPKSLKDSGLLFFHCTKINIDVSTWDVGNLRDAHQMFDKCILFEGKGLEKWNTKNLKDISWMFMNCENLDADFSNWNTKKLYDVEEAFKNCLKFTGKGLENWDISNVRKASIVSMLDGCDSLKNKPAWYKK